jgi:hypothetical protein
MAEVFISHAHHDEELAGKVRALLVTALDLDPGEVFLSSEAGHGVAPGANVLESILSTLRRGGALVVVLTPAAAKSPWVWLETGSRLSEAELPRPLFVVPSTRFVRLMEPVADWRCLRLDEQDELHELVRTVGENVGKEPRDVLDYASVLAEVVQGSRASYSVWAERRVRLWSWAGRYAVGVLVAAVGVGMLGYAWRLVLEQRAASARARAERLVEQNAAANAQAECLQSLNQTAERTAKEYMALKGRVTSHGRAVHGAIVLVTRDRETQDPAACHEPACTRVSSTTEGQFTIDLTKIQVDKADRVVLSVVRPGFWFYSKEIEVDVRAMDVATAPLIVPLAAKP